MWRYILEADDDTLDKIKECLWEKEWTAFIHSLFDLVDSNLVEFREW